PRRQLRAEDRGRGGPALAVPQSGRIEFGRRPPAVVGQLVRLLLLDEEPGSGEEPRPAADVVLVEPAVVGRLAAGDRDQQAAARSEHPAELAERGQPRRAVVLGFEAVAAVVGADVLEGRDAEDEVEAAVLERELADVGLDAR